MIKPVAAVLERSRRLSAATAVSSLVELATLRLTVAEPAKPLLVQIPRKGRSGSGAGSRLGRDENGVGPRQGFAQPEVARKDGGGSGGGERVVLDKSSRMVSKLDEETRSSRARLGKALDRNFFDSRYNEWCCSDRENGSGDEGT